jgi:hypothetical protein
VIFSVYNSILYYAQDESNVENAAAIACETKGAFFQPDRVTQLLHLLLNNCLLLSAAELSEWSEDAEIFYVAQEGRYIDISYA